VKKKSVKGLKFRRIKFFDMFFALALFLLVGGFASKSYAGNDPITKIVYENPEEALELLHLANVGGGNDPTSRSTVSYSVGAGTLGGGGHDPRPVPPGNGGGGHDPAKGNPSRSNRGGDSYDPVRPCVMEINDELIVTTPQVCELKRVSDVVKRCESNYRKGCAEAEARMEKLIYGVQKTYSN